MNALRLASSSSCRSAVTATAVVRHTAVAMASGERLASTAASIRPATDDKTAIRDQLRNVLEEYRLNHYTQEVPTRFKKEIVAAACSSSSQQRAVRLPGLEKVLHNIGMQDRISHQDLETMFRQETGQVSGAIDAERLQRML